MLKQLSQHDKFFQGVAFNICKDKTLAKDLVQDMYIKLYETNSEIKDLKWYGVTVIRNLYRKHCKDLKTVYLEDEVIDVEAISNTFEPTDEELRILKDFNKLSFLQKNLIEESYYYSLRSIQKEFDIHYKLSFDQCKKARKKLLGDDYKKLYKNARNKRL